MLITRRNPRLGRGFSGGAEGIRTPDLLNAIQTRSQLRHGPTLKVLRPVNRATVSVPIRVGQCQSKATKACHTTRRLVTPVADEAWCGALRAARPCARCPAK